MPDFAPDMTPRYVAKYISVGLEHEIMYRTPRDTVYATGVAAAQLGLFDILSELVTSLPEDFAWVSAKWFDQFTDVALPAAVPASITGLQLLTNYSKQDKISHLTFSGKGFGGSKVSWKVFGVQFDPDELPAGPGSKFVFNPGDVASIDAAVGQFNAAALLACIDNTKPIVYGRVTFKVNDHYLRDVRRGIL